MQSYKASIRTQSFVDYKSTFRWLNSDSLYQAVSYSLYQIHCLVILSGACMMRLVERKTVWCISSHVDHAMMIKKRPVNTLQWINKSTILRRGPRRGRSSPRSRLASGLCTNGVDTPMVWGYGKVEGNFVMTGAPSERVAVARVAPHNVYFV